MLRRPRRALFLLAALTTLSVPRTMLGQDAARRADFDFVIETVARESAGLVRHRIDWRGIEQRYRERLNTVRDDVGHIALVSELLAECRDSHTGLLRHDLRDAKLPSKWDGLASAGLWIVEDEGRFHVAGRDGTDGPPPGATLATIGDWPFHLAMERELRRCSIVLGISSKHSFFASIGNRGVPMGEATEVELGYLDEGKLKRATVRRWGPSGRGFDLFVATVPEGLKHGEGAVATMLEGKGKANIGYVRITGSMNGATAKAFHGALDRLKGADAIVLDCRGMGGGSDDSAWEMAGRFFVRPAANGSNRRIEPSGAFQHAGPVVMIQDSLEVSSAETFTWAMSETGRALSVGRPTGGWSIIPRRFSAPSGRFDFRVGVTDRKTPIKGLLTEGIGWAPDVLVPLGPMIAGETRFQTDLALAMARVAVAGDVEKTRDLFALLGRGRWDEFRRGAKGLAKKVPGLDLDALADLFAADLEATLQVEWQLLELVDPPDCVGAARRLEVLRGRAHTTPAKKALAALDRRLKALAGEARAQEALLDALDRRFSWSATDRDRFLAKAGKTRYGAFAREHLPAR
jgi:hypothetical protein